MTEEKNKKAKVHSLTKLEPGVTIDMRDWHIACSLPDGSVNIASMDLIVPEQDDKGYEIQKGVWRVTPKAGLQKIEFGEKAYYPTKTTHDLHRVFNNFKNNIKEFDFLGIPEKKRGVLLGSVPGVGKSSLISNFCKTLVQEKSACVLYIDSQEVDYETIQRMFRRAPKNAVEFIVLVIEDIGGSGLDARHHNVDSTLLNFLDGQEGLFKIPTLVVATTNYLDVLGTEITSRPGRFDIVMEVAAPGEEETIKLVTDFVRRELTPKEKECIKGKGFTPAYLRECVIRHKLDSISLEEAVNQLSKQRELSEKKVHRTGNKRSMGFSGFGNGFDE